MWTAAEIEGPRRDEAAMGAGGSSAAVRAIRLIQHRGATPRDRLGLVITTFLLVLPLPIAWIVYVLAFNPTDTVIDPTGLCTWHLLFGVDGPTCGITRMTWYLLHGDIINAARMHLAALVLVPLGAYAYLWPPAGYSVVECRWSELRNGRRSSRRRISGLRGRAAQSPLAAVRVVLCARVGHLEDQLLAILVEAPVNAGRLGSWAPAGV
jgi:hypothetical protein